MHVYSEASHQKDEDFGTAIRQKKYAQEYISILPGYGSQLFHHHYMSI